MKRSEKKKERNSLSNGSFIRIANYFLWLILFILATGNIYFIFKYQFLNFRFLNYIYSSIVILFVLSFLILNGKKKLSKTIFVLSWILGFVLVLSGYGFYSAINIADNLNKTTAYSQVEMSVVVPKDSSISNIEEVKEVSAPTDADSQNITSFLNEIKQDKGIDLKKKKVTSYQEGYESLLKGDGEALVLNSAYSSLLETIDQNYKDNLKTIYTYKIKKEKANLNNTVKQSSSNVFNIYISGIDTYGDISTVSRSDVNIIMTVNMDTHKILLTTTPRDSYVQIPDGGANQYDKLTHAGIYGVETSMKTLENLYGIDIDYYTRINFTSFLKLIDLLGGVEVYNDQEFVSWNGGYEFKTGLLNLDSERALGFIRERYSLSGGDNDRGKNQEKVIAAIINKLTSVNSISKINQIVENLQGSVQTNMSIESINKIVNSQLSTNQHFIVSSQAVTGTGSTGVLQSYAMPSASLYMMSLDSSSINQAKTEIENIMEGK